MSKAKLIFDSPERNADLYYATRFLAPDDVLYLEHRGKKYFILSDLEFERGRKEAKVDKVYSLAELTQRAKKKGLEGSVGVITQLLREYKVRSILVPKHTSFTLVDGLRKNKITVTVGSDPFCPKRSFKTAREKKWMVECQRTTFKAIALAENILRQATIRRGLLHWKGKILTSERIRFEMEHLLLKQGFKTTADTIVAGGVQGCDPHDRGSGPLKPHQAILVDCFPRADQTRFYGDATRTFCKGKASPELKKQFAVVKAVQELAIRMIKPRVNGKKIYKAVVNFFNKAGYPTQVIDGYKQGFIHGVGHGIGLEIHEAPVRIGNSDFKLEAGHVVTVEPGLYYRKIGGARLEDIVMVTKTGAQVLANYPKRLEIL